MCNVPESIPLSDQRWLLVAWSADFANVGPTLAIGCMVSSLPTTKVRYLYIWANSGFLFRMAASNNRGFRET